MIDPVSVSIDELDHRVKNTLAIVQSLARQTFKGDGSPQEMMSVFEGRIAALAAAHNLLSEINWEAPALARVISETLAPFGSPHRALTISGPDVGLSSRVAVSLALSLHELATNASKYGALSVPEGELSVEWTTDADQLKLVWKERGGPQVSPPTKRGFGTQMIKQALGGGTATHVDIKFEPQGLVCVIEAPLPWVSS